MSRPSTNGIVIVGAGPYGLSVAAHLGRRGLPFRIFGSPMQSWRSDMPAGMFLKSESFASSLSDPAGSYTLKAHCEQYGLSYGDCGVPVPLETFSDYGIKFQQRFVPDVEDTRVLSLHRSSHGYELQTATGELLAAKSVVVAVGISQFRHIPQRLAHLPRELVSHTSHHRSFGAFSGRDVTVIGGGQSALETAALAREQGANVRVLVRQPRLVWNEVTQQEPRPLALRLRRPMSGLGDGWRLRFYATAPGGFHRLPERMRVHAVRTVLGPAGAWWLKERVLGQLPVLTGHSVVSAEADGNRVRLRVQRNDGRVIDQRTEHLIAGTGYRVDLGRLPLLSDELRERLNLVAGAPALSSSFEASAPDLYFVGLAAAYSFGPVMRFVEGADYSARRLVGHLLAKASGRDPRRRPSVPKFSSIPAPPEGIPIPAEMPSSQYALWCEGRAFATMGGDDRSRRGKQIVTNDHHVQRSSS